MVTGIIQAGRVRSSAALGIAAPWLALGDDIVHRVTVRGTELAWVEQGSGTPVVFVHGSGADLRTWGYQMAPVAQASFRAIAYSRRFHHPNAPPTAGDAAYTAALHADDLAAFIDARSTPAPSTSSPHRRAVSSRCSSRSDRPSIVRSMVLTEPAMFSLLLSRVASGGIRPHRSKPRAA